MIWLKKCWVGVRPQSFPHSTPKWVFEIKREITRKWLFHSLIAVKHLYLCTWASNCLAMNMSVLLLSHDDACICIAQVCTAPHVYSKLKFHIGHTKRLTVPFWYILYIRLLLNSCCHRVKMSIYSYYSVFIYCFHLHVKFYFFKMWETRIQ